MGAGNVKLALERFPCLDHDAMRLLVGMALTSLDADTAEQSARVYYGGQDSMIRIMGRSRRAMYNALRKLTERGIVEVISRPRRGDKNANYRLRLDIGCRTSAPDGCRTSALREGSNEDLRSTFGRSSATARAEPLSKDWQPTSSHEIQAKKLGLSLVETVSDFRVQMANVNRRDWDKTFSAYLKSAADGSQYDHFPIGDMDLELTSYSCPACDLHLPITFVCSGCHVQYRNPDEP